MVFERINSECIFISFNLNFFYLYTNEIILHNFNFLKCLSSPSCSTVLQFWIYISRFFILGILHFIVNFNLFILNDMYFVIGVVVVCCVHTYVVALHCIWGNWTLQSAMSLTHIITLIIWSGRLLTAGSLCVLVGRSEVPLQSPPLKLIPICDAQNPRKQDITCKSYQERTMIISHIIFPSKYFRVNALS